MPELMISIDDVKKDFESILEIEGNTQVFFSGPFGVGKTSFLSNFFESNSEKYDVYHLFPVNYQIHSNDDVISLLKYDILVELFNRNKDIFESKKVSGVSESSLLFYSWLKENYSFNGILQSTISLGETLGNLSGDPLSSILVKLGRPLKSLLEVDKNFQKFKTEYRAGEKGQVEKYEKTIREKNTSESDYISALIKEKVHQEKGAKKSVLVLDDMDRIDPEHIFRILNILSAHFERDRENKFGFDLIIIVADYSNLKAIFHHRYGIKTDFAGYMDKFYTINPYYFDNKKALLSRIDEIVKSIKNQEPGLNSAIGESGYIKLFLEHIFSRAIDEGIINLRQLFKATKFQLLELRKGGYYEDPFSDNFQKLFDTAVKVAIHSFSNIELFCDAIRVIKNKKSANARMPFKRYILTMLKSFGIEIPTNGIFNGHWEDYQISSDQNGFKVVNISGKNEEDLFHDLLIRYVESRKYVKTSQHDYHI